MSCLGLEYFCFEGDGLWTSSDADLIALAEAGMRQDRPDRARATWSMPAWCASRRPTRSTTTTTASNVAMIRRDLEQQLSDAAPGRPQRHAQVQQPGPRHDDRDAHGAEHPGGRAPLRRVGRQRGRRVPRGRCFGRPGSACAASAWCRRARPRPSIPALRSPGWSEVAGNRGPSCSGWMQMRRPTSAGNSSVQRSFPHP